MIKKKTVLILGAGASHHAGLPIGGELSKLICSDLRKEGRVTKLLIEMEHGSRERTELLKLLSSTRIDTPDFVLANSELQVIGKRAIALTIGFHENENELLNSKGEKEGWYRYLWNRMYAVGIEKFKTNKIKVITFNYDRSFEVYFLTQIRHSYGLSDTAARELYSDVIEVVHVHGAIGNYDLVDGGGIRSYLPKWYDPKMQNYEEVLKQTTDEIVLATQASVENAAFKKAHRWLKEGLYIVFIGCAFHELNMTNLKVEEVLSREKYIFASTYGLEKAEIQTRLHFLKLLKNKDGQSWPPTSTARELSIGNQNDKATDFLKKSVWFDIEAHEADFIGTIMERNA